jgi:hypothetical protein
MDKYQELVEDLKKTDQLYSALKEKVNGFIKELAGFLGCNPDVITVEFEKPNYFDKNDTIIWKFRLVIHIITPDHTVSIPISEFTLTTLKKTALEHIAITYTGAEQGATIETISNTIFQNVKKLIDGASWI